MIDRGSSIKITKRFRDFLDNVRATRRSKAIGTDEELLSQKDTCDLLFEYFKNDNERFIDLIKMKGVENV